MAVRAGRLLVLGLSAVLVAGCTGGGGGSESASGDQAASDAGGGSGAAVAEVPGAASADAAPGVDAAGVGSVQDGRLVVSTGTVAVLVEDVTDAGRRVSAATEQAGGLVTASGTGTGGRGAAADPEDSQASGEQAHYTLRVPGPAFEQVLDAVGELGRVTDRSTSATDVTAEVADVGSRVASAQAVLTTFRDRLPQASSIPDVLALEGEIARRQADLEALQARQRVLADQVALATVEVTLTAADPADPVAADAPGGFLGGLSTGWSALATFLGAVAVVLGVVLPFALPAAAVAGVVVLVRRRRGAGPAADA